MIAKLKERGDIVTVCDFDDFAIEELDKKSVSAYERKYGKCADYKRWICKINGEFVLLYVIDTEGSGYRVHYVIGKKEEGLLVRDDYYSDRIIVLGIDSKGSVYSKERY